MNLENLAAPALHLVASDVVGFSKIGGLPNLPEKVSWPLWKEQPLAFICQLSLAELPQREIFRGMPRTGYLYFFYDQEQSTWGFDPADLGSWQVIYSNDMPSSVPRTKPDGLEEECVYDEVPIGFRLISSLPDAQRLPDEDEDALEELMEAKRAVYSDLPRHQIGGYPDVVQNDSMELESQLVSNGLYCGDSSGYDDPRAEELAKGASDWVLLLQIDSDDDVGTMWGDCGVLYFWIREQDLMTASFDKTWMVLQCG